jgi:hypothetical protein
MAPSNQCSPGKLFTPASASAIRIVGVVSPPRRTTTTTTVRPSLRYTTVKSTQRSRIYIRLKLFGKSDREIGSLCDPPLLLSSWIPSVAISRNGIARLTAMRPSSDSYWRCHSRLDGSRFAIPRGQIIQSFFKTRSCTMEKTLIKIYHFNIEKCL